MSSVAPDTRRSTSSENGIDAPRSPSTVANPEPAFTPSQQGYRGSDSGFTNTPAERKPASEFVEGRLHSVNPRLCQYYDRTVPGVKEPLGARSERICEALKRAGVIFPKGNPEGRKECYAKELEFEDD